MKKKVICIDLDLTVEQVHLLVKKNTDSYSYSNTFSIEKVMLFEEQGNDFYLYPTPGLGEFLFCIVENGEHSRVFGIIQMKHRSKRKYKVFALFLIVISIISLPLGSKPNIIVFLTSLFLGLVVYILPEMYKGKYAEKQIRLFFNKMVKRSL